MRRWLIWSISLLVGVVALALAVPLGLQTAASERTRFIQELEIETLSTASVLASQPSQRWQSTVEAVALRTGARVVIVDTTGTLVADSDGTPLNRPFDRPEIDQALDGALVVAVRPSATVNADLRLVAAPIVQDTSVVAAVRMSLLEDAVVAEVRRTQLWLAVFVLAVISAGIGVAWLLARWIGAPLDRLAGVATALPDDLSLRADAFDGPREVRFVATALNSTADRLEGLVARTRRVAADASHHLRTPLTGIRLRLEAIEEITADERVREQATAATLETDRLTRRIGQILDLARSDSATRPVASCDAPTIVAARVEAASVIADERDIALQVQCDDTLTVPLEPGSLARIVDELLGNAFAYARSTVAVSVTADLDSKSNSGSNSGSDSGSDSGSVLITVDDDGPGVADTEYEAIFERFTRGHAAIDGGSGLGLALVREAARSSGGDALAMRSPLGGLRLVVRLPHVS